MNSTSVSESQNKMRKSLRNRSVYAPYVQPKKSKSDVIQGESKQSKLGARKSFIVEPTKTSQHFEAAGSDQDKTYIEPSKIESEKTVNRNQNFNAMPANRNDGGVNSSTNSLATLQSENDENDRMENQRCNNVSDSEMAHKLPNEKRDSVVDEDNRNEIRETPANSEHEFQGDEDLHSDSDNNESDDMEENCVESVLKDFSKDIGALYNKYDNIKRDIKEIKEMLIARPPQNCIRSFSSRLKQKSAFSLLPKFPLKKRSAVRKMAEDIDDEFNEDYKDQMIKKLASFGGNTVNELVINIFKKLFSSKLKTKYCWTGSVRNNKSAFKYLAGIREVIWAAVQIHFEDCTEVTINKEIKLRLNQAPKDYAREMGKKNN